MDVICRKYKEKWFKTLQSCNSHRLPLDLRLDEENHDKLVAFVSGNTQLESFLFWAPVRWNSKSAQHHTVCSTQTRNSWAIKRILNQSILRGYTSPSVCLQESFHESCNSTCKCQLILDILAAVAFNYTPYTVNYTYKMQTRPSGESSN